MIFIRNISDNDICQLISLCEKVFGPQAKGPNKDGLGYGYNEYVWISNTLNLYQQAKDPASGCIAIGGYDGDKLLGFLTANYFSNWYDGSYVADLKDVCTDMTYEKYHEVFEKLFNQFINHYAELGITNWRADTIRAKGDAGLKFGNYIKKRFSKESNIVLNTSVRGVFKN